MDLLAGSRIVLIINAGEVKGIIHIFIRYIDALMSTDIVADRTYYGGFFMGLHTLQHAAEAVFSQYTFAAHKQQVFAVSCFSTLIIPTGNANFLMIQYELNIGQRLQIVNCL